MTVPGLWVWWLMCCGSAEHLPDPCVDPSDLRGLAEDPDALLKTGRALLHRADQGGFDGYRISMLDKGALPFAMGFRNGDIVHDVAGADGAPVPLVNLEVLEAAHTQLRDSEHLTWGVTRRGRRIRLELDLSGACVAAGIVESRDR